MTFGAEAVAAAMRRAIALAAGGRFRVEPNPQVGAVVLDAAGAVAGEGCHEAYGGPHAERNALAAAGDRARGGTLVVSLEPCAHARKKTPPCVDALLEAGVARVVFGTDDPNEATTGRAAALLREHGVEVASGVERAACESLIARYAAHRETGVPWTIAKWAMTADGRTADDQGASRWISGPISRALVHELRARVEAIVVGTGTVVADDPRLTARGVPDTGLSPALRVVVDSQLRSPLVRRVFREASEAPTLVLCGEDPPEDRRAALVDLGVTVQPVRTALGGRVHLPTAMRALHERGVRRVLLEAGPGLTGAALRAGVVHQVAAFVAPVVVGGGDAPTPFGGDGWPMPGAPRLQEPRVSVSGDDALLEGYWPPVAG